MEYTVVISQEPDTSWRAVVPSLPSCEAEAETRDQVISRIREQIEKAMRSIEMLRIEIPSPTPKLQRLNGASGYTTLEEEWPDFGIFHDDPTLDDLFDEIERRRDEHIVC